MTPLTRIRQGILDRDIEEINQGYFELTGETLVLDDEQVETNREEDGQENQEDSPEPTPAKNEKESKRVTTEDFRTQIIDPKGQSKEGRRARKEPVNTEKIKTVGNIWEDSYSEEPPDSEKLKQAYGNYHKHRKPRKKFKKVRKTCTKCKQTKYVKPIDVVARENFLCDECVDKRIRNIRR